MRDEGKTKKQLITELTALRQRIADVDLSATERLSIEQAATRPEEELRAVRARLEYLITSGPGVIYTCEPSGDYGATFISENVKAQMGYAPTEFMDDPKFWASHIHQEDAPRVLADLEHLFKKGHHVQEYRFLHKDGSYRWMRDEMTLFRDRESNPREIIGCRMDITERKKAEEKVLAYQGQLRSLASELSLAEERERRLLATKLHDGVGQMLSVTKVKLGTLSRMAEDTEMKRTIDEIRDLIGQTIQNTRTLTFNLSPPILYELGFEPAVEWLTDQIREQHGFQCTFEDDLQPKPMDDDVGVVLFQGVRELLINIVKHAQARTAKVLISRSGDDIQVRIEDDGKGFEVSGAEFRAGRTDGFGLFNIRERLDYLGGSLELASEPGCGTRVFLTAPLKYGKINAKEIEA